MPLFISTGKKPGFSKYSIWAPCSIRVFTKSEMDLFRKLELPDIIFGMLLTAKNTNAKREDVLESSKST